MEDNINTNVELEESETSEETEEETYDSSSGSVVAGIVGGFIAYVVIDGAKKLWHFIAEKRAQKKLAKENEVTKEEDDTESEKKK